MKQENLATRRQFLTGIPSPADVLSLIEPIDPDTIHYCGGGMYQARWLSIATFGEMKPADQVAALRGHPLVDHISTTQTGDIYQVLFRLKETMQQ